MKSWGDGMLELLQGPILKLLPDFAIIGIGALMARRIDGAGWAALDKLNFFLLFPALLFVATSSRPIAVDRLLQVGGLSCLVILAGFTVILLLRRFGPEVWLDFAGCAQNAWRFSTPLAFVVAQVMPPEVITLLAAGIGVSIPLVNALAVMVLSRGNATRRQMIKGVLSNPFFLASLAGIFVNVLKIPLPEMGVFTLDRLSQAALPMILLSIGAALDWSMVLRPDRFALVVHSVRLLVLPALVWTTVTVLGQEGIMAAAILIFSALPTSSSSHLLAARFGADYKRVAAIVTQSSVFGCLSLPMWTILALRWVM